MKAIDLFSGAGGLSLGLTQAGIDVVLANEIEHDFAKTHELNHSQTLMLNQDIHTVDFVQALATLGYRPGDIDLVCGGPPCQGFSTVGKKNFADPRNSLFGQFLRVTDEVDPSYILFENVAGFKRLYGGAVYELLLNELSDRGFTLNFAILNAKDYGLPQSRDRTIIVGWRNGENAVPLPAPTHGHTDLFGNLRQRLGLMDAISDLPPLESGMEAREYLTPPQNDYQRKMRANAHTLTEHNASKYGPKMRKILSIVPTGGSVVDLPIELRPKSYFKNTYARLLPEKPSPTITRNFGTPSSSRCIHPFQPRALSTREGARLQGFPDSYVFYGSKMSKNLQIGNAVPPIFGEILGKSILDSR